jgi:hypothetical protein
MSFDPIKPLRILALDNTPQKLLGASGTLELALFDNPNEATVYLQVFDGEGVPTVGTDKPAFFIAIPPGGGGLQPTNRMGIHFRHGLAIACTTTPEGNTAPATAINGTLGVDSQWALANINTPSVIQ